MLEKNGSRGPLEAALQERCPAVAFRVAEVSLTWLNCCVEGVPGATVTPGSETLLHRLRWLLRLHWLLKLPWLHVALKLFGLHWQCTLLWLLELLWLHGAFRLLRLYWLCKLLWLAVDAASYCGKKSAV